MFFFRKKYQECKHSQKDLEFMQSLSSAVMTKAPIKSSIVLWVSFFSIVWLIFWASFAEVDEITKGSGTVIPSEQVQVIQNLEGGIVSKILIKEGQHVKKGDILLKIDDKMFTSSFNEQILRLDELRAKAIRLLAQMEDKPFKIDKTLKKKINSKVLNNEKKLYISNMKQLQETVDMLKERVNQKKYELRSLK
ncbi:MAG: biotin/lipoyl-binding protein, partial [Campylobacterota bacterium]|nr:biotin/lipoyl-binding protein [Campylobacterota bacterium]